MAKFTEFRKKCFHCDGRGYSPDALYHRLALDLLVDAADCTNFNMEEARRLYRLAATYEDKAADDQENDHKGRRLPKPPFMAAVHRRNAIYLRALADQDVLTDVERKTARIEFKITPSVKSGPMALSFAVEPSA